MIRLGYLEALDKTKIPNFDANAQDLYKNPWYDNGNVYSMVWQSGITGIGYDPNLTGREITTFDDLLDPAFAGHIGLFSEMRDTLSLALLSNGVTPTEATIEQVTAAKDKLLEAAERGQFRNFYGNDYYDELANGNLWATRRLVRRRQPDEALRQRRGRVRGAGVGRHAVDGQHVHPQEGGAPARRAPDDELLVRRRQRGAAHRVRRLLQPGQGRRRAGRRRTRRPRATRATPNGPMRSRSSRPPPSRTRRRCRTSTPYKQLTEEEETQWNELFNEVVAG